MKPIPLLRPAKEIPIRRLSPNYAGGPTIRSQIVASGGGGTICYKFQRGMAP
jgi:hypothetical protein